MSFKLQHFDTQWFKTHTIRNSIMLFVNTQSLPSHLKRELFYSTVSSIKTTVVIVARLWEIRKYFKIMLLLFYKTNTSDNKVCFFFAGYNILKNMCTKEYNFLSNEYLKIVPSLYQRDVGLLMSQLVLLHKYWLDNLN